MAQSRPECDAEREELRHLVNREVDRLPDRYRVVVVLCDLQGESYETAAARLRVPVGTIRSRLSRARDQLRGRITRCGLALPAGALAAVMTSGGASEVVPAHLVASTLRLATASTAGGLATGTASTAALAYADGVVPLGGLIGPGKVR